MGISKVLKGSEVLVLLMRFRAFVPNDMGTK